MSATTEATPVFKFAAREIALRRGIPIIPIPPREKGAKLVNWTELATTDKAQLTIWLNENPDYNAGAVAKPDGVWILDIDNPDLSAILKEETGHDLPRTLTVKSSKGLHYYFNQNDSSRSMGNLKKAGMFDAQVIDKYVVAPGSIHPSGIRYEIIDDSEIVEAPEWLTDWVKSHADAPKVRNNGHDLPVAEDFDIADMLAHYGIGWRQDANWYITDVCPVAGRKHEQSTRTGFYFDGHSLGFHCFAGGCDGCTMTVGQVLKRLNKEHKPYPRAIWPEEPTSELLSSFDVDVSVGAEPEAEKSYSDGCGYGLEHVVFQKPRPDAQDIAPAAQEAVVVKEKPVVGMEFPEDALYGVLGKMARDTQCQMGFAYPAVLAVASAAGVKELKERVRGNLYVALVGGVGTGKTVSVNRAAGSIFLPRLGINRVTPGSDRGLIKMLGKGKNPVLLVQDEFRNTMSKCNIQGSSLAPVMCDLWSNDIAGAADKKGVDECEVQLSILGNLACEDAADFSSVFGGQTTKGLADRFIFGFAPPMDYSPVDVNRELLEPCPCRMPDWAFEMRKEWTNTNKDRRRLGEIALRIALVASACNGEQEVSRESMAAALRFCEWQETIRSLYRPGVAESKESECLEAIASELNREYDKQGKGARVHWAKMLNRKSWYRRFSGLTSRVKVLLEEAGIIEQEREEDEQGRRVKTGYVIIRGRIK